MGLKLSDLDNNDVEYLPGNSQVGAPGKLRLSDMTSDQIQFVPQPKPSAAQSAARGLANQFGLEPTLAGLAGVAANAVGKAGIDKVESTHPKVQAQLDQIADQNTPSANDVFKKAKGEEDEANQAARQANPMSYYAANLLPSAVAAAPKLVGALKEIPVGTLVKHAIAAKTGIPSSVIQTAGKVGDTLMDKVAQKIAARVAAQQATQGVAEGAAEAAPEVLPAAAEQAGKIFDPFLKRWL